MNYSILEKNTMDGWDNETETCELYLRGAQRNELLAFKMAQEWYECLKPFLDVFIKTAAEIYGKSCPPEGLREFIRERQFRRYFPQGRQA